MRSCHSGAADRRDLVRAGETWRMGRPSAASATSKSGIHPEIIPVSVPAKRSFGEGLERAPPRASVRLPFSP